MKRNKKKNQLNAKMNSGKDKQKKSKYQRKYEYLNRTGLWGFEVAEPKPWK